MLSNNCRAREVEASTIDSSLHKLRKELVERFVSEVPHNSVVRHAGNLLHREVGDPLLGSTKVVLGLLTAR